MFEHCTADSHRHYILDEILQNVDELCRNQYGNYVVQHILKFGSAWHKSQIINAITGVGSGGAAAAAAVEAAGADVAAAAAPSVDGSGVPAAAAVSSVDGVVPGASSPSSHTVSSGSSSSLAASAPHVSSPRSCKVFQLAKVSALHSSHDHASRKGLH